MKKLLIRTLSVILTVTLLTQVAPLSGIRASAASATSTAQSVVRTQALKDVDAPALSDQQNSAVSVSEDTSLRTVDTKHFLNEDGSYSAMVYPQPVHYLDSNGDWIEIDNSLIDNGGYYAPKSSGATVMRPSNWAAIKFFWPMERLRFRLEFPLFRSKLLLS
jgi:hypothetical protein